MQSHAVGEVRLEQIVVASGDFRDRGRQQQAFTVVEVRQAAFVRFGQDERFEGPGRPPGADGEEGVVFVD